jgi:hypothetical protein
MGHSTDWRESTPSRSGACKELDASVALQRGSIHRGCQPLSVERCQRHGVKLRLR